MWAEAYAEAFETCTKRVCVRIAGPSRVIRAETVGVRTLTICHVQRQMQINCLRNKDYRSHDDLRLLEVRAS